MIFRRMTETDLDKVTEMENEIFSTPWSKTNFEESLRQSYSRFFVAVLDDIVGYCGVHNLGGDGEITNVAVDGKYRGRGIAYEMLCYAMEETQKEGVGAFTLEVRVSNTPAVKLYEKLGFENCGVRKNFYENPTEDAIIMWKNQEK
ncbi:MAG: ribosomal protein S18-alanine N-acetyltransferase [Lachnospiraceae bacterium]|nr:ribosomal protein S18-alanine N-acetyltransferase [Lachnospiraceae bacterium]